MADNTDTLASEQQVPEDAPVEEPPSIDGVEEQGDGAEEQGKEADTPEEKPELREWEKLTPMESFSDGSLDDVGTPLLEAAREHNFDRVKQLVAKGEDLNAQHKGGDLKGMSSLHWAAGDGHPDITKYLIDHGIDIYLRDAWGQTALHHAAGNGQLECVRLLVDAGMDIMDMDDAFGQDALHWACSKDKTDLVEWLLDQGAQINRHDNDGGLTPLHIACSYGTVATAAVLLERGANINALDKQGRTPIMAAANKQNAELFKMLLDAGASLTIADKSNMTIFNFLGGEKLKEVYERHAQSLKDRKKELKRLFAEGPMEWDAEEVSTWMRYIKLDNYAYDFFARHIDGPRLLAEGGALLSEEKLRPVLNRGLYEAQRRHQQYVEMKQHERQMDMALSAITSFILALLIVRFFRRLFQ